MVLSETPQIILLLTAVRRVKCGTMLKYREWDMLLRVYTITPEKVLWTVFYYVALKEEKETGPS